MIKIRLCCVAGILSNVIVNKMRDAAKLRELEVDIQGFSESQIVKNLDQADVVLLGPQMAYKLQKIKSMCEQFGIACNLVPMKELGMMNGNNILDIALNLFNEEKDKQERQAIERELKEENEWRIEENKAAEKATQETIEGENEKREMCESKDEKIYNQITKIHDILNVKGEDNMIKKIKELILSAEKEIYISSNIDITEFKDEIVEISQRGVRLTVVSFKEYHGEELPIDTLYTYVDEKNRNKAETIMIVVDSRTALVGEKGFDKEESSNIITDNPLLVSVIYKNILNNIYHLKLRDNIAFKLKDM